MCPGENSPKRTNHFKPFLDTVFFLPTHSFNDTTSIIRYTEYQLVNSVYFLSSLDPYFTA